MRKRKSQMISSMKGYTFSFQQKLLRGHQFSSGSTPAIDPKPVNTSKTGPDSSSTAKPSRLASCSLRAAVVYWNAGSSSHTADSTKEVSRLQRVWLFCW